MGQHRPRYSRGFPPPPEPSRSWWLVRETFRKAGVFLLAILVGLVIFILVFFPFAVFIWWLLQYAKGQ